ncbi:hypothetical protein ACCD00_02660 [Pseudomonas sp. Pseusp3]|uniref:hypothetical protein n=1 Tax=Pseudomonas sp. Pseusp3 TaxID=3243029 RepID=UPI0039AFC2F4
MTVFGRFLPVATGSYMQLTANMVTKRASQIGCKRVVKWSAVFQLVFQPKIKTDINVINQYLTEWIQITPAHQLRHQRSPPCAGFVVSGCIANPATV